MSWICAGKTRGAYWSAMAWILAWLRGNVLVVEEALELDGDELDDGEDGWWIISLGWKDRYFRKMYRENNE